LRELRVLIAEAETGVARLLEVLMKRRGHSTQRAIDGAEALRLAREGCPDIIVMDPVMSIVEGDEVLRRLKNDPATARIPIVLVATAEVLDSLENNGYEHVSKPFEAQQLNAAMERALSAQAAQQ